MSCSVTVITIVMRVILITEADVIIIIVVKYRLFSSNRPSEFAFLRGGRPRFRMKVKNLRSH